jgi:hypothetical protein
MLRCHKYWIAIVGQILTAVCSFSASYAQNKSDYTRSLLEASLILHDVHHGKFAVMPGLSLLNFEVNLRRTGDTLTSCSWYVCTSKTEVRISDLETCTAQFKSNGNWRFYYLNNIMKDEIAITPFPFRRYGYVIYRIKLTGEENIYCTFNDDYQKPLFSCQKEIMMYVSDDKIADFRAVLTYIIDDVCTGAKRERKR